MSRLTYREQLNHPNWQRRRLERLEAAGWKCQECRAADQQLHVHHEKYIRGLLAWEYADALLKVLCHRCHSRHHVPVVEAPPVWPIDAGSEEEQRIARLRQRLLEVDAELKRIFATPDISADELDLAKRLMGERRAMKLGEAVNG